MWVRMINEPGMHHFMKDIRSRGLEPRKVVGVLWALIKAVGDCRDIIKDVAHVDVVIIPPPSRICPCIATNFHRYGLPRIVGILNFPLTVVLRIVADYGYEVIRFSSEEVRRSSDVIFMTG